ncbi:Vitamin K epoxide reductase [Thalassoporum mexicanum PCC 7367]|uniref:vitamin K epoxide reductase family protein n=1 Tax=Thalassoporum mexicanum TaxID=3457544 RepID=UPI00029FEB78|nr:vitamin K epoxide reductase family protein [Pseudanabaena sp. PCC 7367]AFY68618.1 Vitamin K epoxide reductase [Pseudanabaena sp. PCC 7367]
MPKSSESWLQKWTRPIVVGLALCGALLTGYLTATHFLGANPVCLASSNRAGSGCDLVLNSSYAQIAGLPLTGFGLLGYLTVAGLAAAPMLVNQEDSQQQKSLRQTTAFWLFMATTAMLVFSGYLMYLLAFVIVDANGSAIICPYCLASAATVLTIWLVNLLGNEWEEAGQLLFSGLIVVAIVGVGTLGIFSNQSQLAAESNSYAGRLAHYLDDSGAKMYGAFWCPHCKDQKAMFGTAAKALPYVECDPRGENSQPKLCKAKKITGFPTWEIDGQFYASVQSLDKLADLTGYDGPRQ